jgi:hypothetical protein
MVVVIVAEEDCADGREGVQGDGGRMDAVWAEEAGGGADAPTEDGVGEEISRRGAQEEGRVVDPCQ